MDEDGDAGEKRTGRKGRRRDADGSFGEDPWNGNFGIAAARSRGPFFFA